VERTVSEAGADRSRAAAPASLKPPAHSYDSGVVSADELIYRLQPRGHLPGQRSCHHQAGSASIARGYPGDRQPTAIRPSRSAGRSGRLFNSERWTRTYSDTSEYSLGSKNPSRSRYDNAEREFPLGIGGLCRRADWFPGLAVTDRTQYSLTLTTVPSAVILHARGFLATTFDLAK
jgi:hypothetical protein